MSQVRCGTVRLRPFELRCEVRCRNCDEKLVSYTTTSMPRRTMMVYEMVKRGRVQHGLHWFCGMVCLDLFKALPPEL